MAFHPTLAPGRCCLAALPAQRLAGNTQTFDTSFIPVRTDSGKARGRPRDLSEKQERLFVVADQW